MENCCETTPELMGTMPGREKRHLRRFNFGNQIVRSGNGGYAKLARQVRVFVRDGFIDRYSGEQLMYPGALLILQRLRSEVFGAGADEAEMLCRETVLDEMMPKISRVVPLHLGGKDEEDNWVTVSVRNYVVRGIRTPAELGWELQPLGNMRVWDGMMSWFMRMMESSAEPGLDRADPELQMWYRVARSGVWVD